MSVTEKECLFCKIARGEIPSKKVYEDKDVIAFLDINPANPGHTLVVPKKHADDITKSNDSDLEKTILVVKKIATDLREKFNALGVNVIQNNGQGAGQIVSHIYFHVIPRFPNDKVLITYQRTPMSENDLEEIKNKFADKPKDLDFDF